VELSTPCKNMVQCENCKMFLDESRFFLKKMADCSAEKLNAINNA
jgi:hypothetical protein